MRFRIRFGKNCAIIPNSFVFNEKCCAFIARKWNHSMITIDLQDAASALIDVTDGEQKVKVLSLINALDMGINALLSRRPIFFIINNLYIKRDYRAPSSSECCLNCLIIDNRPVIYRASCNKCFKCVVPPDYCSFPIQRKTHMLVF